MRILSKFKQFFLASCDNLPIVNIISSWIRKKKFLRLANQDPQINANRCYKHVFNKNINWKNPKNLIEKIYFLQLYTDTSLWTLCADKYRMREFVIKKGFDYILPELYGHWGNSKDIDYAKLPKKFVLKTTNGCGQIILVKDKNKLNLHQTNKLLDDWMQLKYGFTDAQIHYSRIKTCIIAEEMLTQSEIYSQISPNSLMDFKIWCFKGRPECILITYDRTPTSLKLDLYSPEWDKISKYIIPNHHYKVDNEFKIPRPNCLNEMLSIASALSQDFPEVRLDFYIVNDHPKIGEFTFTSGYGYFTEQFYNYLGDKINLSEVSLLPYMNRPPQAN